MKTTRRLLCALLALTLVLALAGTAFAAGGTTGTITIQNAISGQSYSIYKIFDLESYSGEDNEADRTYSYKVDTAWKGFFAEKAPGAAYITLNDQGYIIKSNLMASNAETFAKDALAWAKNNTITATATQEAQTSSVTFDNLSLGYYLLDSTMGTLCSLDTIQPDATIQEKNTAPTLEKKIVEGGADKDANSVTIGDTVQYKATIHAHKGAYGYVFKDTMAAGLTLQADTIKVKVGDTELSGTGENKHYTLNTNSADGLTFTITFEQSYLDTIAQDTDIVITYDGILNENAVIGGDGNTNTAKLAYGEKSTETPDAVVRTYTYTFNVLKYTQNKDKPEKKPLAGAKFKLFKEGEAGKPAGDPIQLVAETPVTGDPVYRVATGAQIGNNVVSKVVEIETQNTGAFIINGLDAGTYYLMETQAPTGYNKLKDPVKIEIIEGTQPGTVTVKNGGVEATNGKIEVENNTGTELPSTGGMGTTIFYIIGSVLVIGAVVLLVTKKRMSR